MAPRFKRLLFQTYTGEQGTTGFVGFPVGYFDRMPTFRNALRDKLEGYTHLQYRTDLAGHWEIDVYIRFFEGKDAENVNAFYAKPWPGCFAWLFRTRHYREYKVEEARVRPLIQAEISTCHDYPCVVIEKSNLTENEIAQHVENAAKDLSLDIVRSKFPFPMNAVLMSNRIFD